MSDRSAYFKKYYQEHKEALAAYYKDKYEQDKKKALTRAKTYYILNREMILLKAKLRDTARQGHAHSIWNAVKKYAKKWNLNLSPWNEFRDWTMTDDGYESVYLQWKEAGFDRKYSPVVMRAVKKNGFIIENLKWDYREAYSWWSSEMQEVRKQEEDLNQQQIDRNKRDKAWRKKIRDEWKAKRKDK